MCHPGLNLFSKSKLYPKLHPSVSTRNAVHLSCSALISTGVASQITFVFVNVLFLHLLLLF